MFLKALVLLWSLCLWGALAVNETSPGPLGLRLVDGDARCRGQLQVRVSGQDWVGVRAFGLALRFLDRVCAELGCGSAVAVGTKEVKLREAVFLDPERCQNSSLELCPDAETHHSKESLQLNCSESVRLVSGRSLCSGSLQIRASDRSWTSVCEGALDRRGAEVLCRELGCGAPLLQGALSPLGQMFHCEGHESALMDCPRNQTRTEPGTCPTLQLTCSEPLRLVGARCEGTLEVQYSGQWRRVQSFGFWDLEAGAPVCGALGCGSALSFEGRRGLDGADVWGVAPDCVKEAGLRDCVTGGHAARDRGLEVRCLESVRLVSGRSLCSGSLQIRASDRSWTSVCEGALDRRGAEVLCRELGCGAPLLQGALSPLGQTFHCEGHESALMDCPRNQTRTEPGTCPTLQLTCSEPLRLVGGPGRCEGTLEVQFRGQWRRVVPFGSWDLEDGAPVCGALGCGSAVSTGVGRGYNGSEEAWVVYTECAKRIAVRDCVRDGFPPRFEHGLELRCSG